MKVIVPEVAPMANRLALVPVRDQVGAGVPVADKVVSAVPPAVTETESGLPLLVVIVGATADAVIGPNCGVAICALPALLVAVSRTRTT